MVDAVRRAVLQSRSDAREDFFRFTHHHVVGLQLHHIRLA